MFSPNKGPTGRARDPRAAVAASLVTSLWSLRGVAQLEVLAGAHTGVEQAELRPEAGEPGGVATTAADTATAQDGDHVASASSRGATTLLPVELWGSVKAVADLAASQLDVMTGPQLAKVRRTGLTG